MRARPLVIVAALLGSSGCSIGDPPPREVVLCPGAALTLHASNGRDLQIRATGPSRREYVIGDGRHFEVELTKRSTRWYGALGLYRPVGVADTHMVLQEAVQRFSNEDEAAEWVQTQFARAQEDQFVAVGPNGIFVSWLFSVRPPGAEGPAESLSVNLYQVLVSGTPPAHLPAGSGTMDVASFGQSCPGRTLEASYVPSSAGELKGRRYTGRALDVMREKGASADAVENLIRTGRKSTVGNEVVYSGDYSSSVGLVITDKTGRVTEVQ